MTASRYLARRYVKRPLPNYFIPRVATVRLLGLRRAV